MDKTKTMGQNISRHDNSCLCGVFKVQIGYQKGFLMCVLYEQLYLICYDCFYIRKI